MSDPCREAAVREVMDMIPDGPGQERTADAIVGRVLACYIPMLVSVPEEMVVRAWDAFGAAPDEGTDRMRVALEAALEDR